MIRANVIPNRYRDLPWRPHGLVGRWQILPTPARLRDRHPGKPDRELIEDLARIELGFASLADVQSRGALSEAEATQLGVRAVHEARSASA
ncbi:MAG: hypothetical protein ACRDNS_22305 [Trebonia sp.]